MKFRISRLLLENLSEMITTEVFSRLLENAETISPLEAVDKILRSNGIIFTVEFIKRDGTKRIMNARLNVKKYLKGGELRYSPVEKGLIPVYDMNSSTPDQGYRMINVSTITALRIGGKSYIVDDQAE